jgi:hypothetical protein
MRRLCLVISAGILMAAVGLWAQENSSSGPYKILKTAKVGGDGGFDYVWADSAARKLYVSRSGANARITVWDLDTLEPAGVIPNSGGHGAAVSSKTGHGFATTKPVLMFDAKTLAPIKTIDTGGNPDGFYYDSFNDRVYILSHATPNLTALNASDGSIAGTADIDGATEQTVGDGKGHIYADVEDKGNIAVIDAATMKVTAHYDLQGKGGGCAGLAIDAKNRILFASCRDPQNMVILNADDGKILATLPIGAGTDGAAFNPQTMEAFSSQRDGTLTVVKENSPTSFAIEQTVQTMTSAKTLTLDTKTGRILLIAAQYGPPPAAPAADAAGGRGGRGAQPPMIPDSFTILVVGKN